MNTSRPTHSSIAAPSRDHAALAARIREIAGAHPRYGYLRVLAVLNDEGWRVGRKLVYRLYSEGGFQIRRVSAPGFAAAALDAAAATGPQRQWSVDLVHGRLGDQRIVRIISVVDAATCESVWIEANLRATGLLVTRALERAAAGRALPRVVSIDQGSGFSERVLREWAARRGVRLAFTQPGTAADAAIERVSERLRDVLLGPHPFMTVRDLLRALNAWRHEHNDDVLRERSVASDAARSMLVPHDPAAPRLDAANDVASFVARMTVAAPRGSQSD